MVESFQVGARQIRQRFTTGEEESKRTERDLSLGVVGIGVGILFLLMAGMPVVFGEALSAPLRVACALLVVIFAFFFVTVSSRIVGLVGVTSNPTSGMTIATLLASSSLFLLLGWTDMLGKAAAITVGCVVAIAASIAGDTSQDLKTGFLLGATPRRQQLGEIVGVLTSATFVCLTILLLSETFGFGTPELPAPQATLMKVVVEGVIDQSLPWTFVLIGVGIALAAEMLRIPSLPFAGGVYLPVSTMIPLFLGGVLRWILERKASNDSERTARRDVGVLLGSGFVGGEGIVGVGIAAVAFSLGHAPAGIGTGWAGGAADGVALLFFAGLVALLVRSALGARPLPTEEGR
jgi:putative OPT family oligopeptide transporter